MKSANQEISVSPALLGPGTGTGTVRSNVGSQSINGSGGSYYQRAPVAPPSVPSEYLSRQELGIYSSKKELNQSINNNTTYGESGSIYAYGGPVGYNRARQGSQSSATGNNFNQQMSSINTTSNSNNGGGYNQGSEYADTLGRGLANVYLHEMSNYSATNGMLMMNANALQNNANTINKTQQRRWFDPHQP